MKKLSSIPDGGGGTRPELQCTDYLITVQNKVTIGRDSTRDKANSIRVSRLLLIVDSPRYIGQERVLSTSDPFPSTDPSFFTFPSPTISME